MSNNLPAVASINDMPVIIPEKMDKKKLFNSVNNTSPVAELIGKKFKIIGIIPEKVMVPKSQVTGEDDIESGEVELVERMRMVILTDQGAYHSFSVSFNSNIVKILNVFGSEYVNMQFEVVQKMRGSGSNARAFYVVSAV